MYHGVMGCSECGGSATKMVRGYCMRCYQRMLRSGAIAKIDRNPIERFNQYVGDQTPEGCLPWVGAKDDKGYGMFWSDGKSWRSHRWAYAVKLGVPPKGMHLDHLCRNRACVNVDHFEVVTPAVNILRGEGACAKHARKTHCKRGHPFDSENTHYRLDGSRRCKACQQMRNRGEI